MVRHSWRYASSEPCLNEVSTTAWRDLCDISHLRIASWIVLDYFSKLSLSRGCQS